MFNIVILKTNQGEKGLSAHISCIKFREATKYRVKKQILTWLKTPDREFLRLRGYCAAKINFLVNIHT